MHINPAINRFVMSDNVMLQVSNRIVFALCYIAINVTRYLQSNTQPHISYLGTRWVGKI